MLTLVLFNCHLFYTTLTCFTPPFPTYITPSDTSFFPTHLPHSLLPSFPSSLAYKLFCYFIASFLLLSQSSLTNSPSHLSLFFHLLYSFLTCIPPPLFSSPYFVSLLTSVSLQSTEINLFCTSPSSLIYFFFLFCLYQLYLQ